MAARDDIRSRIIGNSPVFKEALERAERAAKAPTKIPVGLDGERGTGKELFAKLIHKLSTPDGPFVAINCAAISPGIAESEFFGHDVGAFTGATKASIGAFERANGGTLFLDEIHTLPLEIQSKLLRVLQEMEIQRVGSGRVRKLNMRIITAWNCDLEAMCRAGTFKRDLYDRINVYVIKLPALRERRDDILPIARHLLQDIAPQKTFSPEAEHFLENNICPGNIRVMRNLIWAAVVDAGESEVVGLDHIQKNLEGKLPGYGEQRESNVTVPTLKVVDENTLPIPENSPERKVHALQKSIRHQIILSLLEKRSQASSSDFLEATRASKATIERDLKELVEAGVICRFGRARNTCYMLVSPSPSGGKDIINTKSIKSGIDNGDIPSHELNSNKECNDEDPSRTTNGTLSFPDEEKEGVKKQKKKAAYTAILESAVKAKPISELMRNVGRKDRSKFRNRFIRPLLVAGLLQMTDPDNPRSSKQKYLATKKGIMEGLVALDRAEDSDLVIHVLNQRE